MSEEFHAITVSSSQIESELNRLGVQGWQVINCWSAGGGTATCILKRTREFFCSKTKSFQPCRPLRQLDLPVALARCLDQPDDPLGKSKGIRLADLGREFGADEAAVFERLKECGLAESEKLKDAHAGFCDSHLLWVSHPKKEGDALWLNVKKVGKKSKASGASSEASDLETPAPEQTPPSADPDFEEEPGTNAPSIEEMIALCLQQPLKNPKYPHSISLRALAENFHSDRETIHEIIRAAGIPDTPPDPKKPFTKVSGYFVKMNNSKGHLYLNVKPKPDWGKQRASEHSR